MEFTPTLNKIKLLFQKLQEPNYVMNNYYVDAFLNKFHERTDPEIKQLSSMPLLSDLLADALGRSEMHHITVKVFLVRLLAKGSYQELHFSKMFSQQGHIIAKGFKEIQSSTMNPSLRVAYLEVALSLVTHNSGICWLLETGVWKEILSLCNERRTVFVVRFMHKFAAKFLWKLNDLGDAANLNQVISFLLKPMEELDLINPESVTREQEKVICKVIDPILQILLAIFAEENRISNRNILMKMFETEYYLSKYMSIYFDRIRNEETSLMLIRLIFWCMLAKIFSSKPLEEGVIYNKEDFLELTVMYYNTLQFLIKRRNAKIVLDYCTACNVIWCSTWQNHKYVWQSDVLKTELQNQMLVMSVTPLLVYISLGRNISDMMLNERFNTYVATLLNTSNEHTARAAYAFRELIEDMDTINIVTQTAKRLTCLKNHLNDDQANIMFQALFFVLKDYDPTDNAGELKKEECYGENQERVVIMTYIMEAVLFLVKHYSINWHESLEIICLYTIVNNILKRPNLPPKFVVTALNILTLTVRKFLPPNLSLLMESKPGSSIHDIGQLIYTKMHDLHWEVRDSALELLFVCTDFAYIKFPPFQKQINDSNLINVAATIALNDYEWYVQATALKCIGAAAKIPILWDQLTSQYPNIQEQLLTILRTNSEGVVRKEACNVLCEIYQHIKISSNFKQTLYEFMVSAALSDFHWEVQISALKFWKMVIQTLLSEQGMLDGTFPPVTFSRETRKIVTLNEAEIQKRLFRVLDELSYIGCLTVLVKLLNEDSEIEIMELSLTNSVELLEILNKHKVPDLLKPSDGDPFNVDELMCHIQVPEDEDITEDMADPETTMRADNVIDTIIQVDDISLLANIYERYMNLQSKPAMPGRPKIKLLKSASPHLFVTFLNSKDFKGILEQKKKWKDGIRSLSSLLDDILGIYETSEDVNTLDCY
ncbi:uncharacterized protein LOC113512060 [Galleria mellonella]|uniref:Uncharacterized protein LOC113512060 n=1 Tax=Galleria mellonella TaxID=7137 RepID=A0A6J3BZ30_GALME|nr:uncharacterized protein LOC113512060 [Galleria mellonella]XP_031765176.1 uncharacterized protein LOC113512060 [Galleria mellonella]